MDANKFIIKAGRRVYSKLYPGTRNNTVKENYFGSPILLPENGNHLIAQKLNTGDPLMVCRLGSTELSCLVNYIEKSELAELDYFRQMLRQIKGESLVWSDAVRENMHKCSGFFPATDENLEKFARLYLDLIPQVDILGVWYNYFEDIIVHRFCPDAALIPLKSIEPYYFESPWSRMLKGKKVLVIHPFDTSIKRQYAIREKLFENKEILPPFELTTIKAVQTVAYNNTEFKNWFEALDSMIEKINKTDFDVALIGAGAYGLPLAAHVKMIGKQAIHFGGSLQVLFGIKGQRWDNMPNVNRFYNEYWIRPLQEETPDDFKSVENGCYW